MNKNLLIAGALVLGIAAFVLLRSSGSSSKESEPSAPKARAENARPVPTKRTRSVRPEIASARRKGIADRVATADQGDGNEPTLEYLRNDGSEVRDHRENPPMPQLEATAGAPKSIAKVAPKVVMQLRRDFRPIIEDCTNAHAANDQEARAQVVVKTSLVEEMLSIDSLEVSTRGIEASDAFVKCVDEQMRDHTARIEGAADHSGHTMTFPFDL